MRVKLKDIADFVNGRAFKSSEWSDQGLPIIRIQNLNDPEKPFNYFEGEYDQKNFVQSGNILLSWSGTPGTSFGCFKWTREDGLLNQHIFKVQLVTEKVDQDYFVYAVNKNLNILIDQSHGGVGLKHITKGKLNEVSIYLPPLDQQKKIAAILDAADAYRQKTKALIEKYDELTQSLFLDMFGDPVTNPNGWNEKPLGELGVLKMGGTPSTKNPMYYKNGNINWIKSGDIKGDFISSFPNKITQLGLENSNTKLYSEGTVVIALNGQGKTRGTSGILTQSSCSNQSVVNIDAKNNLNSIFLHFQLKSRYNLLRNLTGDKDRSGLNLNILRNYSIHVPPKEYQNQFAERVQAIEEQKVQAQASLAQAEDLFNSLLQRAFKGELTN